MLRAPGLDPFLGRPISLFDADAEGARAEFVYQIAGRGTQKFSEALPGQTIEAQGPYGNGFPILPGDAVLIGGRGHRRGAAASSGKGAESLRSPRGGLISSSAFARSPICWKTFARRRILFMWRSAAL